ncbi:NeuD/PglB/VioB family sugar acetyltransferase [Sediminitomix flava]|uniref:Sugar O-acyltransferase (Sialic acid O-acetyltransferase NeuD family) n=1 Tax=Sediminitomix flava TaxID=379075 RepID=A0A315ZFS5_SEDFL|nr:NeuD/PglB/VioB family sugar acetyltransferase [Sediminitomix flava]PWJ43990.1 sugar O-acyltransferase (sialic acid O-acetyltransferase NeuD family) [Sediminitomix flava]
MENPVIIFGATGLGKVALDIFNSQDVLIFGMLDDDKETHGLTVGEVSILGKTNDDGFLKYIGKKAEAFVAIEDPKQRKAIVTMLNDRRKVMPVNAVHKDASVSSMAFLGHGNMVNAGAVVGAESKVPNHCILNAGVVLEADVELGDFVQIGARAVLQTGVVVGEGAVIGAGAIISRGVKIGKGAQVGPNSLVLQDVEDNTTVFGSPAQVV